MNLELKTEEDMIKFVRSIGRDPNTTTVSQLLTLVQEHARADEREECARVAEKMLRFYTQAVTGVPEAIRARGSK